jgi:REP element-mobilizing transposase RayT
MGQAILATFADVDVQPLALAVCPTHAHLLAELPQSPDAAMRIIHRGKGVSSRMVSQLHPDRIWTRGVSLKSIADRAHQLRTYHYNPRHDHNQSCHSFRPIAHGSLARGRGPHRSVQLGLRP